MGNVGNGVTDDTAAVQAAINSVAGTDKILFVNAGVYIIRNTITIPKDTRIVGECWATFAAQGPAFSNAKYVFFFLHSARNPCLLPASYD